MDNYNVMGNIIIMIVVMMAALMFGLGFYLIYREILLKKHIHILKKIKRSRLFDMYKNKAILLGFRLILFGLIHAFFLDYNIVQLSLLISTKVFLIMLCIFLKNLFRNNILKLFTIIYFTSAIFIDILLLVSQLS